MSNYLEETKDFALFDFILLTFPKFCALLNRFELSPPWRCAVTGEGGHGQGRPSPRRGKKQPKEVSVGSCPLSGRVVNRDFKGPWLFQESPLASTGL